MAQKRKGPKPVLKLNVIKHATETSNITDMILEEAAVEV